MTEIGKIQRCIWLHIMNKIWINIASKIICLCFIINISETLISWLSLFGAASEFDKNMCLTLQQFYLLGLFHDRWIVKPVIGLPIITALWVLQIWTLYIGLTQQMTLDPFFNFKSFSATFYSCKISAWLIPILGIYVGYVCLVGSFFNFPWAHHHHF